MEKMQLRPHHVFCERFLKVELPDRGSEFEQVQQEIKDLIETDEDTQVKIIEGVDDLCKVCPDLQDDRCQNLFGNEDAVRKWDGIIIKGLDVSYGEIMTSGDWRRLIEKKSPLDFCRNRCQWKSICTVFKSDALVKSQKYDGKEKSSSSRRANYEE